METPKVNELDLPNIDLATIESTEPSLTEQQWAKLQNTAINLDIFEKSKQLKSLDNEVYSSKHNHLIKSITGLLGILNDKINSQGYGYTELIAQLIQLNKQLDEALSTHSDEDSPAPAEVPKETPITEPIPTTTEDPTKAAFEAVKAGHTLGCLFTEANPKVDSALNERIKKALEAEEDLEVVFPDRLRLLIAKKIDPDFAGINLEEAKSIIFNKFQLVLQSNNENDGKEFDLLVQNTVTQFILDNRLQSFLAKIDGMANKIAKNNENSDSKANQAKSKLIKAVVGLSKIGLGVGLGSWIRQAILDGQLHTAAGYVATHGLQATNLATRALSGFAGAVASGTIGAALGGIEAYGSSRQEQQRLVYIDEQIEKYKQKNPDQEFTPGDRAKILQKLVEQGQIRVESSNELNQIKELIRQTHRDEIEAELQIALSIIENEPVVEQENSPSPDLRLAKALSALMKSHANGSESRRTANDVQYIKDNYFEVRGKLLSYGVGKEVAKGVGKGAVIGGLIGGIFGAMWPPAKLFAKVAGEAVVQMKSALATQLINGKLTNIGEAIVRGIHDSHSVAGLNVRDAYIMFETGHADIGQRIMESNYKVEMDGKLGEYAGKTLTEWSSELTKSVKGEDGLRLFYHMLSHPQETVGHFNGIEGLKSLIEGVSGVHGQALSEIIINGSQNGTNAEAMERSIRDYLQKNHLAGQNWFEGLLPFKGIGSKFGVGGVGYEHLIGLLLISCTAHLYRKFGDKLPEKIKGFRTKKEAKKSEAGGSSPEDADAQAKLLEKEKELLKRPKTRTVTYNKSLLSETKKTASPKSKELEQFIKEMGGLHGAFFFIPVGADGGYKIARVWTKQTDKSKVLSGISADLLLQEDQQGVASDPLGTKSDDYDPTLLENGQITVKVYNPDHFKTNKDQNPSIIKKELLDTWDNPAWKTDTINTERWSIADVFPKQGDIISQTFVSPLEVEHYVEALDKKLIDPGENIGGLQNFEKYTLKHSKHDNSDPTRAKYEPIVTAEAVGEWVKKQPAGNNSQSTSLRGEVEPPESDLTNKPVTSTASGETKTIPTTDAEFEFLLPKDHKLSEQEKNLWIEKLKELINCTDQKLLKNPYNSNSKMLDWLVAILTDYGFKVEVRENRHSKTKTFIKFIRPGTDVDLLAPKST